MIRTAGHFVITVHFELWPSCCSICHSRHQHTWCRRYTYIRQWAVRCLCCLHLCDTPWQIFHSAKDCGSEQQSKEKHAGLILHVVGRPGSFDTLYFTNYISWCTKSFPGKLNYGYWNAGVHVVFYFVGIFPTWISSAAASRVHDRSLPRKVCLVEFIQSLHCWENVRCVPRVFFRLKLEIFTEQLNRNISVDSAWVTGPSVTLTSVS